MRRTWEITSLQVAQTVRKVSKENVLRNTEFADTFLCATFTSTDSEPDESTTNLETSCTPDIRRCIQKFPDWSPGARTAIGKALCY
jgi:hypothetical protein